MTEQTPWQPPADYVYPEELEQPDDEVSPVPAEEPAAWSPDEPPPGGPPVAPATAAPAGIRGVVVAVVLVLAIAVLGGTALFVGVTRGGDDDRSVDAASNGSGGRPQLERPEVPEGFQLFADTDGSFAFVVPDGWHEVLLDPTSVRRARARLDDEDPPVAAALAAADRQLADIGGLAFAAESHDRDGSIANVTLVLTPRSTQSLDRIAAEGRAQIEASGGTVSDPRPVTIGDRQGLVADVSHSGVSLQQLYLVSGYRIYLLTLTGVDPATAQRITASLRVP